MTRTVSSTLFVASVSLGALVAASSSSGCVSYAQPHAFDVGRGAEPLPTGTMQAHGAVWGGPMNLSTADFPVAVQGGAGVEGQLADDLAVGFDLGTGVEGTAVKGTAMPTSGMITFQYNPNGMHNLAIRGAGGIGEDVVNLPNQKTELSPWGAVDAGIVTSTKLGPVDGYFGLDVGGHRFIGGQDSLIIVHTKGSGLTNTMYNADATLGANIAFGDLGVFVSANLGGLMLLADETGDANAQPTFLPNSFGLVGVTYHFDAPQ